MRDLEIRILKKKIEVGRDIASRWPEGETKALLAFHASECEARLAALQKHEHEQYQQDGDADASYNKS